MAFSYTYDETNQLFNGDFWFIGGTIAVTTSGVVSDIQAGGVYDDGLHLGGGPWTVTVNGLVNSNYNCGIEFFNTLTAGLASKVNVGATGHIIGDEYGIASSHAVNVTNAGYIAGKTGIEINGGTTSYTVKNSGIIYTGYYDGISLFGSGKHTVINTGTIDANSFSIYEQTSNADTVITNSGLLHGNVNLADGIDLVTNSGDVVGFISTGGGNDIVKNTGTVTGLIDLGDGNDIFKGGKSSEVVRDDTGSDNYAFGDGFDHFNAVGSFTKFDTDKVDGGANTCTNPKLGLYGDLYDASNSTVGVFINLDSKAQIDVVSGGPAYSAGEAFGGSIGVDLIKGFEMAFGGSGNDVIFGNASANRIEGNNGSDHLYGLAGDDYIVGGSGDDHIFGGLGRDTLFGGSSSADHFSYQSLKDSTVALAGRDTILDFEGAFDYIDFRNMNPGNALGLHLIGEDVAFNGSLGAVRALTTQAGYVIEVDVNGDKKADMAIDVNDFDHSNAGWIPSDFQF